MREPADPQFRDQVSAELGGCPLLHLRYQPNRSIALQLLSVEQLVVAHWDSVDRQLVNTIGIRRQLNASVLEELQQPTEVVDADLCKPLEGNHGPFRARTLARSRPSGLDKNPALAQRLVQHRALEVPPFFGVPGANDDHVKGHIEPAKLRA